MTLSPYMKRLLIAAAVSAIISVTWLVSEHAHHIEYPLNVWRMDLDDTLANIGFLLAGIAAIWKVWREGKKTKERTVELEHKVNGGLALAAREHLQDSEVLTTMTVRMDRLEQERDDCRKNLASLKEWVVEQVEGMK